MSLPIPVDTALATLREIVRVCGLPFHIALHAIRRGHWKRAAAEALAAPPLEPDAQLEIFLRAHRPARADGGHVFVSAGEASGENHAAKLVQATREHLQAADSPSASIRFSAFGGTALAQAGADVHYPLSENAVMGVGGVLRALPFVIRAYSRFLHVLRDDRPDLVVLVDYPGMHLVMARAARKRGIPVLHYIAPQYWGWGPWRMARYRKAVDATLTILPFEAAFYARFGIAAEYVGHPLLDELASVPQPAAQADDALPILCIMPGSRRLELEQHLAPMVEIARAMHAEHGGRLRVVLPHRDPKRELLIRAQLDRSDPAGLIQFELGEPTDWLRRARAVLVKSGTGSLEACLCGAPTVVVYVLESRFRRWGYRHLLNVPWFAGANLVAGREVAREFPVFDASGWGPAHEALRAVWADGPEREAALAGVADVRQRLGRAGASDRAARWVAPFASSTDPAETSRPSTR